jgi:hypothetical protein
MALPKILPNLEQFGRGKRGEGSVQTFSASFNAKILNISKNTMFCLAFATIFPKKTPYYGKKLWQTRRVCYAS